MLPVRFDGRATLQHNIGLGRGFSSTPGASTRSHSDLVLRQQDDMYLCQLIAPDESGVIDRLIADYTSPLVDNTSSFL